MKNSKLTTPSKLSYKSNPESRASQGFKREEKEVKKLTKDGARSGQKDYKMSAPVKLGR